MPNLACGNRSWTAWAKHVRGRMPDDAATLVGVGRHRDDLGVGVGHPTQVAQLAVGVAHHHDRVGRAPPRQPRLPDGGGRGSPGRNPDRGCRGGVCGGAHRVGSPGVWLCVINRCNAIGAEAYQAQGWPGLSRHKQRIGFGQQGVAVAQPARHEDLATVHPVDSRIELQFLFDRHDVAVVDLQVGGALATAAGEHAQSSSRARCRTASPGTRRARRRCVPDEIARIAPSHGCGRPRSCGPTSGWSGCCRASAGPSGARTATPTRRRRTGSAVPTPSPACRRPR